MREAKCNHFSSHSLMPQDADPQILFDTFVEPALPGPSSFDSDTDSYIDPITPPSSPVTDSVPLRACRICLAEDDGLDEFISPCQCKGTIKYVHSTCLKSWRQTLLNTGREREVDICTLCRKRFMVRKRTRMAGLLEYRAIRILVTVAILVFLLVPSGYLMKLCIHISIFFTNHLLPHFLPLITSHSHLPATPTTPYSYPLYAPFPVCTTPDPNGTNDLVNHTLLYWFLFPFADARCWHLLLCRCQHLHLGFFFLGSVNNVWTTRAMLSEMYDILADDLGIAVAGRRAGAYRRGIKTFLLLYSCLLIVLFWVHYNLLAFRTWGGAATAVGGVEALNAGDITQWPPVGLWPTSDTPPAAASPTQVTPEDFMLELPLWALRWVTLGVAVCDFGIRRVYRWVTRWGKRVDVDVVVSVVEE
ncbi:hypothetical protein BC937DRAFT_93043 [Endogone sp. FLAS-F59071]|nr:hypothetical protein BC937DRAFT_93043 [Endogone sp. FLAS-F59071]|eukprot:RUS15003.1 hypothetical protein BC937DRAFT_93043 [Endogone sp. FLAS-F59071]